MRVVNQFGDTSLHEASRWGHLDVVRLLLDNQADMSQTNQHGWTPLHFSAAYSQLEVARVLLEAGADVQAKDNVRASRRRATVAGALSSGPPTPPDPPAPLRSGAACPSTSRPATTTWTWPAC